MDQESHPWDQPQQNLLEQNAAYNAEYRTNNDLNPSILDTSKDATDNKSLTVGLPVMPGNSNAPVTIAPTASQIQVSAPIIVQPVYNIVQKIEQTFVASKVPGFYSNWDTAPNKVTIGYYNWLEVLKKNSMYALFPPPISAYVTLKKGSPGNLCMISGCRNISYFHCCEDFRFFAALFKSCGK